MQQLDFTIMIQMVQARRDELGITEADDKACRNSGLRRTPEKRDLLQRIANRCHEAGFKPFEANY